MARKRVIEFYSSIDISVSNWVSLLNYFQQTKYRLTTEEVRMLVDKSEQFRTLLNRPRKEEYLIKRAEREDLKVIKYSEGFGIAQKDVNPNPHKYLEKRLANEARNLEKIKKEKMLELVEQQIEELEEKKKEPYRPSIGYHMPLPMAAKAQ